MRTPTAEFSVGGYQPFSASDWPDHLAAVVFTQGCALACGYCHNPHLIPVGVGAIAFESVLASLAARRSLLDGVVFSGGEPCLQPGLPQAIDAVRLLPLPVALHTSGAFPAMLARVLPALDWIGLDIKAGPREFAAVTGVSAWRQTMRSLDLVVNSGHAFEVRTTWRKELFGNESLLDLARRIADRGAKSFALQRLRIRAGNRWIASPAPDDNVLAELRSLFPQFTLR